MQSTSISDNGNTIELWMPEDLYFAFNKSVVRMSVSGLKKAFVHIGCGDAQYDAVGVAMDGSVTIDVSSYIQSIFDDVKLSIDSYDGAWQTNFARTVSFHFGYELEDGTTRKGIYQHDVVYIWGALAVGETFNKCKEYTAWEGYPFSFPLYLELGGLIQIVEGNRVQTLSVRTSGMLALCFTTLRVGTYTFTMISAESVESTFASVFNYTFKSSIIGTGNKLCSVDVREYREGVYLRWIDRHGGWRYRLFERGDENKVITTDGEFIRSVLSTTSTISDELGYSGRRKGYEVERTIELCAPLVDSDTYDMLSDISSSPVVDVWLGGDYTNWMSVTIKEGTYQKTRAVLQDFICNMVLNDISVQRL